MAGEANQPVDKIHFGWADILSVTVKTCDPRWLSEQINERANQCGSVALPFLFHGAQIWQLHYFRPCAKMKRTCQFHHRLQGENHSVRYQSTWHYPHAEASVTKSVSVKFVGLHICLAPNFPIFLSTRRMVTKSQNVMLKAYLSLLTTYTYIVSISMEMCSDVRK